MILTFSGQYPGETAYLTASASTDLSEVTTANANYVAGLVFAPYPNIFRAPLHRGPGPFDDTLYLDYLEEWVLAHQVEPEQIAGVDRHRVREGQGDDRAGVPSCGASGGARRGVLGITQWGKWVYRLQPALNMPPELFRWSCRAIADAVAEVAADPPAERASILDREAPVEGGSRRR